MGQGTVEYALTLVLVVIIVIVILSILGPAIGNIFSDIMDAIQQSPLPTPVSPLPVPVPTLGIDKQAGMMYNISDQGGGAGLLFCLRQTNNLPRCGKCPALSDGPAPSWSREA